MVKKNKILSYKDFEEMFQEKLSENVREKIAFYNLSYEDISIEERDNCLKRIITCLLDNNTTQAGEERLLQWENGWMENLQKIENTISFDSIIPHYFNKYDFVRLKQKFIKPLSENYEYKILGVILDWLFDKYIREVKTVYEFGCGTGYHLFRARQINKKAILWGLDWTSVSQKIINKFVEAGKDLKLKAHKFDYFNPDMNFDLDHDSVVYTVASLEQVGIRFEKFINYLQVKSPRICIHVEPIAELLDETNLIDFLSIEYFKKRNYLSGFLNYLKKLETLGEIKIHMAKRSFIGSLFIEGYSVIVWSPNNKNNNL